MKSSKYIFTLDLQAQQSQMCLIATIGDTNREMVINFSDGGVPFELEGTEVAVLLIDRPNHTTYEKACLLDENKNVKFKFDRDIYGDGEGLEGVYDCQLVIYDNEEHDNELWSPSFSILVGSKKKRPMT